MADCNIKFEAKLKARELRNNQTEAEKYLWKNLRNRNLENIKFLRQHQIIFKYLDKNRYYVADFYCAEYKTIIEIDGDIHLNDKQKEKDAIREEILKELGYKIIRFNNKDLLDNIEKVLIEIKANILKYNCPSL